MVFLAVTWMLSSNLWCIKEPEIWTCLAHSCTKEYYYSSKVSTVCVAYVEAAIYMLQTLMMTSESSWPRFDRVHPISLFSLKQPCQILGYDVTPKTSLSCRMVVSLYLLWNSQLWIQALPKYGQPLPYCTMPGLLINFSHYTLDLVA